MAKAKSTGRDGIDSWTSNGYGISVKKEKQSKARKEEIARLNESIRKNSGKK